jgi:hypothetical protein
MPLDTGGNGSFGGGGIFSAEALAPNQTLD